MCDTAGVLVGRAFLHGRGVVVGVAMILDDDAADTAGHIAPTRHPVEAVVRGVYLQPGDTLWGGGTSE